MTGCGKLNNPNQQNTDTVTAMSSTLQLPVPDNSYAARTMSALVATGSNVSAIVGLIDTVALPLRETKMHLAQLNQEGQRKNGALDILDTAIPAELIGQRDDANGVINWTYNLNSAVYFQGNSSISGTQGNLNFPDTVESPVNPIAVGWSYSSSGANIVKTVTLRRGSNTLVFTLTYVQGSTQPAVDLKGTVGGASVAGDWSSINGGFYTNGSIKFCWTQSLADTQPGSNGKCPSEGSN